MRIEKKLTIAASWIFVLFVLSGIQSCASSPSQSRKARSSSYHKKPAVHKRSPGALARSNSARTRTASRIRQDSVKDPDLILREKTVATAREYLGTRYKSGGKTPKGFDCSGFVIFVLGRMDIQMAACSADQARCGKEVELDQARAGDLIYFGSKSRVNHVGILSEVSKNKLMMIHSSSSRGVIEENVLQSDYWLRRIRVVRDLSSFPRHKAVSMN
jgi:cell wall-associated NlpC family hydrolase